MSYSADQDGLQPRAQRRPARTGDGYRRRSPVVGGPDHEPAVLLLRADSPVRAGLPPIGAGTYPAELIPSDAPRTYDGPFGLWPVGNPWRPQS